MENRENDAPKRYCYRYPHPAVTADCVVFGVDGMSVSVLLVQRGNEPHKGKWAFPGGFVNIDEPAKSGALRELQEETGLELSSCSEFGTYTEPGRDPRERVISIAYYAVTSVQAVAGADDAANARWFDLGCVPPLAFDHEQMLRDAATALRHQLPHELADGRALPSDMTLGQLRMLCAKLDAFIG